MTYAVNMHYTSDYYVNPAWAPLYPFLINLVMFVHKFPAESAALISGICMIGVLITYVALLQKYSDDIFLKIFFLFLLFFFAKFLSIYDVVWSETLFTLLILLSLYFVINHYEKHRLRDYVFASIFISLASLTRYAGIPFIALFFVYTFYDLSRKSDFRLNATKYLLLNSLSYIPIILYLRSNYINSGTFFGPRVPPNLTIFDNLHRTIEVFNSDFGLFLLILLLISTIFYFELIKKTEKAQSERNISFSLTALVVTFISYTFFIIYTATQAKVDPINTRYYAPIYPIILLFIFIGISNAIRFEKVSNLSWLAKLQPLMFAIYGLTLISFIVQLNNYSVFMDSIANKAFMEADHVSAGFNLSSTAFHLSEFFKNELMQKKRLDVVIIMNTAKPHVNTNYGNRVFFREYMLKFYNNNVEFGKVGNSGYQFSIQAGNENYNVWLHNVPLSANDQQLTDNLKKIVMDFGIDTLTLLVYKDYLKSIGTDVEHYSNSISPLLTQNFSLTRVEKINPYYLYEFTVR